MTSSFLRRECQSQPGPGSGRSSWRGALLCVLAVSLPAVPGEAQTPEPVARLTLAEAIAGAHQTSQRIAEARAREAGALAAAQARGAADRPTLAVSGGYTRTNHIEEFSVAQPGAAPRVISPDIPDNYRTRVFGQWPIYTAGRTDALERAALAEARASGADLESLRADLRLETTQTYWALSTAVESVRVLERALERADAHLRDVRSQLDAGLIPPNEVLNVQTERSRQEVQLIEARNRRMVLALDLARLVDLSPETRIEPVDRLEGTVSLPASGQITRPIPEGVLNGRPERRALILRLAGAEERERAAAAAVRPTVSLSGGVDYARPNTRIFPIAREWRTSWDLGVTVLWTAWDFGRARAEIAEVSAGASAARARLSELDEIIATELRARALDLESSVAAVRAAEEGVRSAVEAERVVTERFNVGVATTTDRLDAQVFVLQAELDRTRALANVRLAEARLERARGQ